MMLETLIIDAKHAPDADTLTPAASMLREGRLVAFPTETVYGLGANILLPDSVRAIYRAKGRPSDNPLIVHVARPEQIRPLVSAWPELADLLVKRFMPGPLTLVLPKSGLVPPEVCGGLDTVAVRIPANPVAHLLLELADVPVAAPSANTSGRPSPTCAGHVLADLDGRIDCIVDGGPSEVGVESTVLDLSSGPIPRILRPGGISFEELEDFLAENWTFESPDWRAVLRNSSAADGALPAGEAPRSPGMKYRHYAPSAPVYILRSNSPDELLSALKELAADAREPAGPEASDEPAVFSRLPIGLYAGEDLWKLIESEVGTGTESGIILLGEPYGPSGDAAAAARRFFEAMRALDSAGASLILAEALPEEGLGMAYMNRLNKAADYEIAAGRIEKRNSAQTGVIPKGQY